MNDEDIYDHEYCRWFLESAIYRSVRTARPSWMWYDDHR